MDSTTLYHSFLLGFVSVTALAVLCIALAGLLTALYLAVPATRDGLERFVFSAEERAHDEAMTEIDRTFTRQVKELRRITRPVVYLEH